MESLLKIFVSHYKVGKEFIHIRLFFYQTESMWTRLCEQQSLLKHNISVEGIEPFDRIIYAVF